MTKKSSFPLQVLRAQFQETQVEQRLLSLKQSGLAEEQQALCRMTEGSSAFGLGGGNLYGLRLLYHETFEVLNVNHTIIFKLHG